MKKVRKFLNNIIYTFYDYYRTGPTASIPFFSAITAIVMILFMNLAVIVLNIKNYFSLDYKFYSLNDSEITKWLKSACLVLPLYLLCFLFFKKTKVDKIKLTDNIKRKYQVGIVIYILVSILSLILIIMKLE